MSQVLCKRQCQEHNKRIISSCFHEYCNENRLVCYDYFTNELHSGHLIDHKEYKKFSENHNNANQLCNIFNQKINSMIKEITCLFYNIKTIVEVKFNPCFDKVNYLDEDQLNQYITNLAYKDKQLKIIELALNQGCKELKNQLNQCLAELKLESLNYNDNLNIKNTTSMPMINLGNDLYFYAGPYFDEQLVTKEIEILDKKIIQEYKTIDFLFYQGKKLIQNNEGAIKYFDQVLQIDPNHYKSFYEKGKVLRRMEQYNESLQLLDKALNINPDYADSLYERKESCQKEWDEVKNRYNILIKLWKFNPQIQNHCVKSVLSNTSIIWMYKIWKDMIIRLLNMNLVKSMNLLIKDFLIKIKNFLMRRNLLIKHHKEAPDEAIFWYEKGKSLSEHYQYEKAVKYFDKALYRYSDNKFFWYEKGI